jgi:pimeloyl-ACP methyl ester carboxylesterase
MCFLNGGLFPETHRARLVQKLLATPIVGTLLASTMSYRKFESTMLSISGRQPPSREELEDLWVLVERDGGRQALARLINYMEQRRANRERWVGALVESRVPRRLICGAVDPVSGAHLADRYRELVPDPDVVLLDGVGHYPQLEDPDRVLDAYFAFRARVS